MKILVLADLEGVSGFDGQIQEHEAARLMAPEINAATRELVRGGATAVDVTMKVTFRIPGAVPPLPRQKDEHQMV